MLPNIPSNETDVTLPDLGGDLPELKESVKFVSHKEPQWGEKGYRKGIPSANKGKKCPRATALDAQLLAFLAKFRVASTETLSLLRVAQASRVSKGGTLTTVRATEDRLNKLFQMGLVVRAQAVDKTRVWSPTAKGVGLAYSHGYLKRDSEIDHKPLTEMSDKNLSHYRMIAHVAAQFMSPRGYFAKTLGVQNVKFNQLHSEYEIRKFQEPVRQKVEAKRKAEGDAAPVFGTVRNEMLQKAILEVKDGKVAWNDFMELNPTLWTLGKAGTDRTTTKTTHWPDLAINLEDRREGKAAKNILVEIELSTKSADEYEQLLTAYAEELRRGITYERVVYFSDFDGIEDLLMKVDKKLGTGLFKSGRLKVLRLTSREGETFQLQRGIKVEAYEF